jgi:hypothetical protein
MVESEMKEGEHAMVSLPAIHAVTIELHGGMLALAAFCIITIVLASMYKRTLGKKTARLDNFFEKAVRYAEPTAYIAAIGGVIGLILSSITGYLITSGMQTTASEALINSPITMNKIMVSLIALELWIIFIVIRSRHGAGLWNTRPLALTYVMFGLMAFGFTMIAGSMGGHMTGKGSILDPILEPLGIDYSMPLVMDVSSAIFAFMLLNALLIISTVFVAYASRMSLRRPVRLN